MNTVQSSLEWAKLIPLLLSLDCGDTKTWPGPTFHENLSDGKLYWQAKPIFLFDFQHFLHCQHQCKNVGLAKMTNRKIKTHVKKKLQRIFVHEVWEVEKIRCERFIRSIKRRDLNLILSLQYSIIHNWGGAHRGNIIDQISIFDSSYKLLEII